LATLQKELDKWLEYYNNYGTHRGKMFTGLPSHGHINRWTGGLEKIVSRLNLTRSNTSKKPVNFKAGLNKYKYLCVGILLNHFMPFHKSYE